MPDAVETRLKELGLTLPSPPAPLASYLPFTVSGSLVFVSGQLPLIDGRVTVTGRLGEEVGAEEGVRAARDCGLNLLAQARAACDGDLGRLRRCLKLGGFVASAPGFFDQPKVVNGASDLMLAVLGDAGRHARFAVGVASLPRNAAVEVEAIFEIT